MTLQKNALISNAKFIYRKENNHLSGKLRYFQHRDDRQTHIKQRDDAGRPVRRWIDRGLGDHHATIARRCQQLATTGLSSNVSARTLVLSPQIELMQAIPAARRDAVMEELTEATVDRWFEAMNLPTAEHAYVIHHGTVNSERPQAVETAPEEFIHSHVVLAATTEGLQGRDDYRVYTEQLQQLHDASAAEMERIWTRELGPDRVAELDNHLQVLNEKLRAIDDQREQQAIEQAAPDRAEIDDIMLEMYQGADITPPDTLLERVHDARARELDDDPVATLRQLGFDIPDDDRTITQQLEALGFQITAPEPVREEGDEMLELARQLGFDIPDDNPQDEPAVDLVNAFRELGFMIPDDESQDIQRQLEELGFDIPGDIESEQPDRDDISFDLD